MHSFQFPYVCRMHEFDRIELLPVSGLGPVNFRLVIFRHIKRCNSASGLSYSFQTFRDGRYIICVLEDDKIWFNIFQVKKIIA